MKTADSYFFRSKLEIDFGCRIVDRSAAGLNFEAKSKAGLLIRPNFEIFPTENRTSI